MKYLSFFALAVGSLCLPACNTPKGDTGEKQSDTLAVVTTDSATGTDTSDSVSKAPPTWNALTSEEKAQGFRFLFDGKTTQGWHSYLKGDTVIGWKAEEGVLACPGKTGADLVTNEEFENFELRFSWNVEPEGNSGVIYKVIEDKKYPNTFETGPEYQIIDDKGYPPHTENGKEIRITDMQKSGANYDIQAPTAFKAKTPGDWNDAILIVNKNHVEHWLNGEKVVEYEYGSTTWKKKVAASKFAKWEYAKPHPKGKIALQDHDHTVMFRDIRIHTL